MKQVMMVKFDSPKWRMIDEYKVANPFIDVGFRQVKDVVDLRVFDLLNISRINNNRAEEMLLRIYCLDTQTLRQDYSQSIQWLYPCMHQGQPF